jgi:hypothetical protein
MTIEKLLKTSRWTAALSFIIGTTIFLAYYFGDDWNVLFIGYAYIGLAGIINIIFLVLLHSHWTKNKADRKRIFRTVLFILFNIPVALVYCYLTLILMNTVRLTLKNSTGSELTDINITGCESKHITELKPNEEKEIWIGIYGDCQIDITFKKEGEIISKTVEGYCTNSNGHKAEYKIGVDKTAVR